MSNTESDPVSDDEILDQLAGMSPEGREILYRVLAALRTNERCKNCEHRRSVHGTGGPCAHATRNPRGTRFRCECENYE
jgi:hypothetical protein